jgi:hypothetical protein
VTDKSSPDHSEPQAKDMDAYMKKAIQLSIIIASMKTALLKNVTEEIITQVEKHKKKKLSKQTREAFQKAIREEVANLPPSIFAIADPSWTPKSENDVAEKLKQEITEDKIKTIADAVKERIKSDQVDLAEFMN